MMNFLLAICTFFLLLVPSTQDINESMVTWFGAVDEDHNYADVRMWRYNDKLNVQVEVIDDRLYRGKDAVDIYADEQKYSVSLSDETPWRGNGMDDDVEDKGWIANFEIPEPHYHQIKIVLHDNKKADQEFDTRIRFDSPVRYPVGQFGTETKRLPVLREASVGGGSNCSDEIAPDYAQRFGTYERAIGGDFNVQNESDVSDFPCFSKYYVSFPAAEGEVVKAELVLHQFGNAGGADWNPPVGPSFIQVASTASFPDKMTWNTSPSPKSIVGGSWVDIMREELVWPGTERRIDITPGILQYHESYFVLYSPDTKYHSGKYFVSNATGDWNAAGRPYVEVVVNKKAP